VLPTAKKVNVTPTKDEAASGINPFPTKATPKTTPRQTHRGGGVRGKTREGRGGRGRGGQAETTGSSFHGNRQEAEQPVRCSMEVSPNLY
jgi:hypothetical protein